MTTSFALQLAETSPPTNRSTEVKGHYDPVMQVWTGDPAAKANRPCSYKPGMAYWYLNDGWLYDLIRYC